MGLPNRSGCRRWTRAEAGDGPTVRMSADVGLVDFGIAAAAAVAVDGVPWGWTFPGHDRSTTGTRARMIPSWVIWGVLGPGLASVLQQSRTPKPRRRFPLHSENPCQKSYTHASTHFSTHTHPTSHLFSLTLLSVPVV